MHLSNQCSQASTSLATLLCADKQTQKPDLLSQGICPGILVAISSVLLCLMLFFTIQQQIQIFKILCDENDRGIFKSEGNLQKHIYEQHTKKLA